MIIEEKVLENVLNFLPYAVFVMEDRKIVYANAMAEKVFGWTPEELIGKGTEILYRSKEEYSQIGETFYPKLEKDRSFSEIFPCKNKEGKDIICNVYASRLDDKLEQKRIVATYEDISERIEAEKELQESEDQYRNFIENTSEIVQSMATDGKFLTVNNAWHKTFGYDKTDIDTLNFFEIAKGDSKQQLEDIFKKVASGEPVMNEELSFVTKDKQEIILMGNFIPRSFYGKVINVRCFFRDLTENRKIQQMIDKKIEELQMFNKMAVDRELKMIELKEKIRVLQQQQQQTSS